MRLHLLGLVGALAPLGAAQAIDFETTPDGAATADGQIISLDYMSLGVRFYLAETGSNVITGFPQIAKVGPPLTAFVACGGDDTPSPGQGVGSSFLTDDGVLGASADLVIEYTTPVSAASGVVIDVDCRPPGGAPPCESWVVKAFNLDGTLLESFNIAATPGPSGSCDPASDNGPGDGAAMAFSFNRAQADIAMVRVEYTGAADPASVGLAFDLFSPSAPAEPISVAFEREVIPSCLGSGVRLTPMVEGGLGMRAYSWQRRATPNSDWVEFSTSAGEVIVPTLSETEEFRLVVSDGVSVGESSPVRINLDPRRDVVVRSNGSELGRAAALLFTDQTIDEVWGSPNSFTGGAFETMPGRVHLAPVVTKEGACLVLVISSPSSLVGGTLSTQVEIGTDIADYLLQDDPAKPGFNDTYTRELMGPGSVLFGAHQTWGEMRTDGYAIGPLTDDLTFTFRIPTQMPKMTGVDSGVIISGDGKMFEFDLVEGTEITFETLCSAACPADLADPVGVLDFSDVFEFLVDFAAMDPDADLAPSWGVFDFSDVFAFLVSFGEGCP